MCFTPSSATARELANGRLNLLYGIDLSIALYIRGGPRQVVSRPVILFPGRTDHSPVLPVNNSGCRLRPDCFLGH